VLLVGNRSLEKEIILGFFGALTAVCTATGALIKYWEKSKNNTIDREKNSKIEIASKIERSLEVLELQVTIAMNKIADFQLQIQLATQELKENKVQMKKLVQMLKDYIEDSSKRTRKLESTLTAASIRKVGEDTYIITPSKKVP